MSIEMENPTTLQEKAEAVANLVQQMDLAHRMGDGEHFKVVKEKAAQFLFEITTELEDVDYEDENGEQTCK